MVSPIIQLSRAAQCHVHLLIMRDSSIVVGFLPNIRRTRGGRVALLQFDQPRSVLPAPPPAGNLAMEVRLDPRAASKRDQAVDLHISGSDIGWAEHEDGFSTQASRLPPVTLLAPLQFLQSHRRGSITDPKLHAAPRPPLLCSPGPISGDLHTGPLVTTFPHNLSGGSATMATSTIAAPSNSVAGTKSRSKRSLKQAEDAGEHFGGVIVYPAV